MCVCLWKWLGGESAATHAANWGIAGRVLIGDLRFELFLVVKMLMTAFWVVVLCGLLGGYQCFGGTLITIYKTTLFHNPEDHHWPLWWCHHSARQASDTLPWQLTGFFSDVSSKTLENAPELLFYAHISKLVLFLKLFIVTGVRCSTLSKNDYEMKFSCNKLFSSFWILFMASLSSLFLVFKSCVFIEILHVDLLHAHINIMIKYV